MSVYRPTTVNSYGSVARALHWLVALLVAAQFVIGWTMPEVHRDTLPVGLIAWHLGVGATLVAAVVLRIVWRATHRPPPDTLAPVHRIASKLTHTLLYAALAAVPLLGWANASSRGWDVKVLGLVGLPALSAKGSALGHEMGDVHSALAWVLLVLIAAHVAAALYHRFVLKDDVLQRML
ncbi:cytochrome b [Trinickia caryophylli]|uniref:Cytochrome b561 n=1 Tax=Trinickia caryophylli TaxID=28094 RepID=A0A1X7D0R6_TRICW|nr:cytochrome b [Trinickia caryophylli]PMS13556.1 cytochrome b [Trinickia caryophylli]TRX15278.1 cytochrome b [Trinickia caryophylli]WQE15154.1 cytochrome b [Trinickia caryophylli]SMF06567.1 cytochrome b561 [Trinickia caryophylli]GLU31107.1 cytochrome b561 [Trinickia caryophylli]